MKIRKADKNDIEVIVKNNILLASETENLTIDYNTVFYGVKNIIEDDTKGFYLVFERNNSIIGQLMITYEWSDWNNKYMWWIQSVYVDKLFRKSGVFNALLNHIKKLAMKNNIKNLKLYVNKKNLIAKSVYNKIGMSKELYDIYKIEL
jgi:N-acetylglutamate synthase-like GNAT family acetyltransferase